MDKKNLRIIFMGTPDFAVESLKILVENNYNIVGVITMPDKPIGRGHKIQYSAVKSYALQNNLPLLQPEKLKNEDFLKELADLKADLQIVVAFRMLPEIVWNMPKYGTFNLHASLLPQYRGAAPINWAIINGETETGVTTFFLTHEIDTGKIILQQKVNIGPNDNVGVVHDQLMLIGSQLVKQTVDLILKEHINAIPQDQLSSSSTNLKSAPKLFKETCCIDWSKDVVYIHNFIRGLSPYPTAWGKFITDENEDKNIKIFSSHYELANHEYSFGSLFTDDKTYLKVAAKGGYIYIDELQFPGKKNMKIGDLLRGYRFLTTARFT